MKAQFNNEEREFNIARDYIPFLEFSLGRGLYSVLKDATEGRWSFNDVAMIVSFALHGPSKEDRAVIEMAKVSVKMGFPMRFNRHYRPHPGVVAALEAEGHGNYAGLMADVLTEAIFGETASEPAAEAEVPDVEAA